MEQMNIYGIVWVQIQFDDSPDGASVNDTFICSSQDGAEDRRRDHVDEPASASAAALPPLLPLLLVNDHPAKSDPRVESYVATVIDEYEARQRMIVTDDDIEAAVRKVLPTVPIGPDEPLPPRLVVVLQELGLGGVLRVDVAPGVGEPSERITVTRIDLPAEMPAYLPSEMPPGTAPEAPIPLAPPVPDRTPAPVVPW
jgi:hypothetical protein